MKAIETIGTPNNIEVLLIFSAESIRVIRVIKPQPRKDKVTHWRREGAVWRPFIQHFPEPPNYCGNTITKWANTLYKCPFGQPGDRLWVKEPWKLLPDGRIGYKASPDKTCQFGNFVLISNWRSPIWLENKHVRIEKLQDITEDDAKAAGVNGGCLECGNEQPCGCNNPSPDYRDSFIWTWNRLNLKRGGYPWESNPWVWVLEGKRIKKINRRINGLLPSGGDGKI
jgi:hypothetical protein